MDKELILNVLFWYLVSWYIVKNRYLQMIFDQLGVQKEKPATFLRLAWDNWFSPFVSCPWCSAFLFAIIGQLIGDFNFILLIAFSVSWLVKFFTTIFETWMRKQS